MRKSRVTPPGSWGNNNPTARMVINNEAAFTALHTAAAAGEQADKGELSVAPSTVWQWWGGNQHGR